MAITITELDDVVVVNVQNDINNETVDEFREILQQITEEQKSKIVMDLGDVQYLCSSGLAIIGSSLTKIQARRGWLRVVNVQRRVLRLFAMTKLTDHLQIFDTVDAAMQKSVEE